jgi:hypothetical protein
MSATTSTIKLSAEFGTAPVGAEVRSWDWAEDEYGYKTRYEFDLIPAEAVTVTSKWAERDQIGHLVGDMAEASDPTLVVRYTIDANGSFQAITWMRFDEALELLINFLEAVK